jgi:hypothetical protein
MKALSKLEAEKGIWQATVDVPRIGHNDVLIKIKRSSICGTDIHIYKSSSAVAVLMFTTPVKPPFSAAAADPAANSTPRAIRSTSQVARAVRVSDFIGVAPGTRRGDR